MGAVRSLDPKVLNATAISKFETRGIVQSKLLWIRLLGQML